MTAGKKGKQNTEREKEEGIRGTESKRMTEREQDKIESGYECM